MLSLQRLTGGLSPFLIVRCILLSEALAFCTVLNSVTPRHPGILASRHPEQKTWAFEVLHATWDGVTTWPCMKEGSGPNSAWPASTDFLIGPPDEAKDSRVSATAATAWAGHDAMRCHNGYLSREFNFLLTKHRCFSTVCDTLWLGASVAAKFQSCDATT